MTKVINTTLFYSFFCDPETRFLKKISCSVYALRCAAHSWLAGFILFFLHIKKRLEAGYEPAKRPTRHTGDVPAPDPHAVKGNPLGLKTNQALI